MGPTVAAGSQAASSWRERVSGGESEISSGGPSTEMRAGGHVDVYDSWGQGLGGPHSSYTHKQFIFLGAVSLPTWAEDRIPRRACYWMLWALRKGAETSEVTETCLGASLHAVFVDLMTLEEAVAVSRDPLPQKSCPGCCCCFSHRMGSNAHSASHLPSCKGQSSGPRGRWVSLLEFTSCSFRPVLFRGHRLLHVLTCVHELVN